MVRTAAVTSAGDDDDDDDSTADAENEEDLEFLLSSVTDAEALLACRAHLQRTNRLGAWTKAAARRKRREKQPGFFWDDAVVYRSNDPHKPREPPEESESSNPLWQSIEGTPYALERLRTDTAGGGTIIDAGGYVESIIPGEEEGITTRKGEEEESTIWEVQGTMEEPTTVSSSQQSVDGDSVYDPQPASSLTTDPDYVDENMVWDIENEPLPEEYYTSSSPYFKLDDETPSLSHTRRSQAAKSRFADPAWKAAWYERRWGNRTTTHAQQKHFKRLEERMRSPQMERFLSHPALLAMDEAEIAHAIATYVRANNKRRAVRRRMPLYQGGGNTTTNPTNHTATTMPITEKLPRDALLREDPVVVSERRRRRSETARQAYRQRLVNQKKKAEQTKEKDADRPEQRQPTPMTAAAVSDDPTPEAALQRIQARLDEYNSADTNTADHNNNNNKSFSFWRSLAADLDLTLQPSKLQGRKQLLRRLLADVWDLRGRCVPVTDNQNDQRLVFVTQSTLSDLGNFCREKIREELLLRQDKDDET